MKRIFGFIICLCVVACMLVACSNNGEANGDITALTSDSTNISTTSVDVSATTVDSATTTSTTNINTTTTIQNSQSTTTSDVTTTTATPVTTTTTQNVTSNGDVATYANYPNVPDYGAMLGVNYAAFRNNVYYYKMEDVALKDTQGNSGSKYTQLLQKCGYIAYQPYDKDGVQGYVYVNTTYGITVLFGAAREQGAIVVAISQQ